MFYSVFGFSTKKGKMREMTGRNMKWKEENKKFLLWIFNLDRPSQVFRQFRPRHLKWRIKLLWTKILVFPSTSSFFLPISPILITKQVPRKALLSFPFSSPYFPSIKHGYGSFISLFGCLEGEKLGKMKERIWIIFIS